MQLLIENLIQSIDFVILYSNGNTYHNMNSHAGSHIISYEPRLPWCIQHNYNIIRRHPSPRSEELT